MPANNELPSTLQRSPEKAQRTWVAAHDGAVEEYGEGERSHRTAYSALKQSFEKVDDHWERKDHKGPSDPQPAGNGPEARRRDKTYGGVDVVGHSRDELYQRARKLGVKGASRMKKTELAEAIARKQ